MDHRPIELTEYIYHQVRQMIFNQEFKPGEKIPQEKVSEQLGVSRTTLFRALQRLENEMLVENIPRRGMFVKKLTPHEIVDLFEYRAVIEGLSARLCTQRATEEQIQHLKDIFSPFQEPGTHIEKTSYEKADREFHSKVVEFSGNQIVRRFNIIENMHFLSYQEGQAFGLVRPFSKTLPEHIQIIEAIANRKPHETERMMREHLEKSINQVRKWIESGDHGGGSTS